MSVCTGPPDQGKNKRDLKIVTHTLLDYIQKCLFCFFEKVTLRAASLEV